MRTRALLLAALAALPALAGCLGPQAPVVATEAAPPPAGEVREFDLNVVLAKHDPGNGRAWESLTFVHNGETAPSLPGPEIRVKEGDTVRVILHDGFHTIHWHGVSVPWAMDGVPDMTQTVGPGRYVYEFVARESGTFWYHCHVLAPVHVDLGMFGALIVEPRDPAADPPFDREATLFFHEFDATQWSVYDTAATGDPAFLNPPANPLLLAGHVQHVGQGHGAIAALVVGGATGQEPLGPFTYTPKYDTFMINGKVFPHTEPVHIKTGETLRLRLINAGQLPHAFHIHGHRALVTHIDGSLLSAPYRADTIPLFPGQRVDVYITGNNPGIWDMHDHGGVWGGGAFAANQGVFPGGMNTMLVYEDFPLADLPGPKEGRTSADYMAFAPSYRGFVPPPQPGPDGTVPTPAVPAGHHAHHAHHGGAAPPPPEAVAPPLLDRVAGVLPRLAGTLWVALTA